MTCTAMTGTATQGASSAGPDQVTVRRQPLHPCVLVGAGPGDPDLLTIKAVKALRRATVVLVDDLVDRRILRWTRRSARIVDVGKRGGCSSTPQGFIEKLMVREALRGERVVRLKGGDPLVFGRAGEEIAALAAAGIAVEVVNGITAGLAAASDLGISLTHRDCAKGVMFITGHGRQDGGSEQVSGRSLDDPVDWPQVSRAAAGGVTLVIYMGLARLAQVRDGLLASLPPSTPVALVERASQTSGRQACGILQDLLELAAGQQIASPAILVVGKVLEEVVSRARTVEWPGRRAVGSG
jgi:uroporphyrin-III C-methyltransferase